MAAFICPQLQSSTQKETGAPFSRVNTHHSASVGCDGCYLEMDNAANTCTACLPALPGADQVCVLASTCPCVLL